MQGVRKNKRMNIWRQISALVAMICFTSTQGVMAEGVSNGPEQYGLQELRLPVMQSLPSQPMQPVNTQQGILAIDMGNPTNQYFLSPSYTAVQSPRELYYDPQTTELLTAIFSDQALLQRAQQNIALMRQDPRKYRFVREQNMLFIQEIPETGQGGKKVEIGIVRELHGKTYFVLANGVGGKLLSHPSLQAGQPPLVEIVARYNLLAQYQEESRQYQRQSTLVTQETTEIKARFPAALGMVIVAPVMLAALIPLSLCMLVAWAAYQPDHTQAWPFQAAEWIRNLPFALGICEKVTSVQNPVRMHTADAPVVNIPEPARPHRRMLAANPEALPEGFPLESEIQEMYSRAHNLLSSVERIQDTTQRDAVLAQAQALFNELLNKDREYRQTYQDQPYLDPDMVRMIRYGVIETACMMSQGDCEQRIVTCSSFIKELEQISVRTSQIKRMLANTYRYRAFLRMQKIQQDRQVQQAQVETTPPLANGASASGFFDWVKSMLPGNTPAAQTPQPQSSTTLATANGVYNETITDLKEALRIYDSSEELKIQYILSYNKIHEQLASVYVQIQRFGDAREHFMSAIRNYHRAEAIVRQQGRLDSVLVVQQKLTLLYEHIGRVFLQIADPGNARSMFRYAVTLDPDNTSLYMAIAQTYVTEGLMQIEGNQQLFIQGLQVLHQEFARIDASSLPTSEKETRKALLVKLQAKIVSLQALFETDKVKRQSYLEQVNALQATPVPGGITGVSLVQMQKDSYESQIFSLLAGLKYRDDMESLSSQQKAEAWAVLIKPFEEWKTLNPQGARTSYLSMLIKSLMSQAAPDKGDLRDVECVKKFIVDGMIGKTESMLDYMIYCQCLINYALPLVEKVQPKEKPEVTTEQQIWACHGALTQAVVIKKIDFSSQLVQLIAVIEQLSLAQIQGQSERNTEHMPLELVALQ